MDWKNQLTKTPVLIFFILLGGIGVGTASAAITITLGGDVVVTDSITADEYFDNGNTQTGLSSSAMGGVGNVASGPYSTIGGGTLNEASGDYSAVGGGIQNTASGDDATIGGGYINTASGGASTIGGGGENTADGEWSTIGGGLLNEASGEFSVVGGGFHNEAKGESSTIPGGYNNDAEGDYSFAAGFQAFADHNGTFVWSDSTGGGFFSSGPDQFLIEADGGVGIGTNNPQAQLHVEGGCIGCMNFYQKSAQMPINIGLNDLSCDLGDMVISGGGWAPGGSPSWIRESWSLDFDTWRLSMTDTNGNPTAPGDFKITCADFPPLHTP